MVDFSGYPSIFCDFHWLRAKTAEKRKNRKFVKIHVNFLYSFFGKPVATFSKDFSAPGEEDGPRAVALQFNNFLEIRIFPENAFGTKLHATT